MVAAELDSSAATVLIKDCKAFNFFCGQILSGWCLFSRVFHSCVSGNQQLEDGERNEVESGNTVVYLWYFSLFWCGIEVWFIVSLSVAVGADTAMFFPQSH